jgi:SOS response regulatory protein OraA/RecX
MDDTENQDLSHTEKKKKKEKAAVTWVQDYLSRRSHSEKELLEKLLKKDFDKETALEAIAFAREQRWLESPEELAQKVYLEWDKKNKSHAWITQYLDEKGLPSLDYDQRREIEKATYQLRKKFGTINSENHQRAGSNLASKGFGYSEFKAAAQNLKDDEI